MNKYLFNTFFLIVLALIIILLPYPSNAEDNYIIDGNIVYINDENVYLSAYPHTIYESGYVYFNLTSKNYNGNIDAAFGFNISSVKPKKAELYNLNTNTWVNFPLSFTLLSQTYQNCDKWYYIKDIPIISNKNYKLRIWIETPITTNINKGKYLFAVKPSFETIQQSIDNNRLYVLDPWFNTSFTDRQKIIITTNGSTIPKNYQILLNVTYNSNMQNDFDDLRFTNLTNGSLSYWIESKINSQYANVWINFSNEIIHPNSDIIYMYYGNNEIGNISNGQDTFEFFDDFLGSSLDVNKWDNTEGMTIDISSGVLTVSTTSGLTKRIYTKNQYSTDTAIRTLAKWSTTGGVYAGFGYYISGGGNYIEITPTYSTNNGYVAFKKDPDSSGSQYMTAISEDVISYNIWDVKRFNTNVVTYLKDEVELNYTNTIYIPTVNLNAEVMIYNNNIIGYFDWYLLRKIIVNEPIISYDLLEYYSNTLYYNVSSNYNHTIESDGTIITNRSLNAIDNTYWTAKSTNITYWTFTKEINISGYTNFTISKDNLNNFSVKLKQYSYYNLSNSSLVNTFGTNQYGNADININLIPDDYYILFINQSLIPPPIKPLYPIQGILIFKDNLCINNINKIIVYKNNSYIGIYNYSDEISYLNNTNYTFFINYDNIDIINSENFLITFLKNYGYILISIIGIIIIIGIYIYFFNKVRK